MSQHDQSTQTDNVYFNLVSVLYHALDGAKASSTYLQDAQQSGDQQLVQFFQEAQQEYVRRADQAKQLLARVAQGGSH